MGVRGYKLLVLGCKSKEGEKLNAETQSSQSGSGGTGEWQIQDLRDTELGRVYGEWEMERLNVRT